MTPDDGKTILGLIALFGALVIILAGARSSAQAQVALEQPDLAPKDEYQYQALRNLSGPIALFIAILLIIALAYAGNSIVSVR